MASSMFNGSPRLFGPEGQRYVILDDEANIPAAVQVLCEHHASGELIRLSVSGITDSELEFLRDLPFLESLTLNRCTGSRLTNLAACHRLRILHLTDDYGAFDFSALPLLQQLQADEWSKQWVGLKSLSQLRLLDARQVRLRGLDALGLPGGLRNLRLLQTSIESLAGLEMIRSLRSVSLGHSPKLVSLARLAELPDLKRVQLLSMKRIADYAALGQCTGLLEMEVEASAPIASLAWIGVLDQLRTFLAVKTDVEDGDLSPLLKLQNLLWIWTDSKRHFQPPAAEVIAVGEQRRKNLGFGTKDDAAKRGLLPAGMGVVETDWAEV